MAKDLFSFVRLLYSCVLQHHKDVICITENYLSAIWSCPVFAPGLGNRLLAFVTLRYASVSLCSRLGIQIRKWKIDFNVVALSIDYKNIYWSVDHYTLIRFWVDWLVWSPRAGHCTMRSQKTFCSVGPETKKLVKAQINSDIYEIFVADGKINSLNR